MYLCNNEENAKELPLSSSQEEFLVQGLLLVKKEKIKAFQYSQELVPGFPEMAAFSPADFGIPEIDQLLQYLTGEVI